MLETVEQETGASPQWSVLWLHGLGADGMTSHPSFRNWCARAGPRCASSSRMRRCGRSPSTMACRCAPGTTSAVWISPNRADAEAWPKPSPGRNADRARGRARRAAGAFAAGGVLAGRRNRTGDRVAATSAAGRADRLSTYLPSAADAATAVTSAAPGQKIFMAHGSGDPVVPVQFAERSRDTCACWASITNGIATPMAHQVCAEEIRDLGGWMGARFGVV